MPKYENLGYSVDDMLRGLGLLGSSIGSNVVPSYRCPACGDTVSGWRNSAVFRDGRYKKSFAYYCDKTGKDVRVQIVE